MSENKMSTIELTNNHVCAYTNGHQPKYVFYTGGIAGVSDRSQSEGSPKALNGRPDEVQLER